MCACTKFIDVIVCVHVHLCARLYALACMSSCLRACVRACVCVCVCACNRAIMWSHLSGSWCSTRISQSKS